MISRRDSPHDSHLSIAFRERSGTCRRLTSGARGPNPGSDSRPYVRQRTAVQYVNCGPAWRSNRLSVGPKTPSLAGTRRDLLEARFAPAVARVNERFDAPEAFSLRAQSILLLSDMTAASITGALLFALTGFRFAAGLGVLSGEAAIVLSAFGLGLYARSYAPRARDEVYTIACAAVFSLVFFLAVCALPLGIDRAAGVAEVLAGSAACGALRLRLHGKLSRKPAASRTTGPQSVGARCVKRGIDLALAIAILPLVFVIGCIIAAAIRWDDGAPVFFVQARVGRNGRTFSMLKFRTMRQSGESSWTVPGDPRITRCGARCRSSVRGRKWCRMRPSSAGRCRVTPSGAGSSRASPAGRK
jgi:hypothetical protein